MAGWRASSLTLILLLFGCLHHYTAMAGGGRWTKLRRNIGITAMHMQLLHNDRVIIYDRTDFGASNISLPRGACRRDPNEAVMKVDCTAHSVEYEVASNSIRPLRVQTDLWCSSGAAAPDGTLVQAGGFGDGERRVRVIKPCSACDWEEIVDGLAAKRWYATSHALPDGSQIIVGGRRQFTYEFYPKKGSSAYKLGFLADTFERDVENNLYPFVFLNVDGNLFIFANNRAILFDYVNHVIVKRYPPLPGDEPRSYPSTGSAVLLPLTTVRGQCSDAEVLVCGGAPRGSFQQAKNGKFVQALDSCGRIKITDSSPKWVTETMPLPRVMGDMLLLPNGNVLIINGASSGLAGWESARHPVLHPVLYETSAPAGSRFRILNPANTPRMYHSSAILLRDGRVLVGGSNPHIFYNFTGVPYPTDLSLEAFSPDYLDSPGLRPKITSPGSLARIGYRQRFPVVFSVSGDVSDVVVSLLAPSFTTHSFAMSQRLVMLGRKKPRATGRDTYQVHVVSPGSSCLAPPGYYIIFLVHGGVPSDGVWLQIR